MKKYQDRLKFSLLNSFVMYMYASHKMHQAWITVAILIKAFRDEKENALNDFYKFMAMIYI